MTDETNTYALTVAVDGTYRSAVRRELLQEYLDELVHRFNRRFWEPQIPNRLLALCVEHLPISLRGT